jgi:formate dehydrogenase subunit delta
MNIDYLTKMANQIGSFFQDQPDQAQATADLVKHIKTSWEPRMRAALLAHVDERQGEGLSEFVQKAIAEHRQLLN